MLRSTLLLAACLALLGLQPASAQTAFAVVLDGSQEQPPSATSQNGSGSLLFDPFTKMLSYQFAISGVTGTFVSATLEDAPLATVGPIVATLSGNGNSFSGVVGPLSATLESELLASSLYINVRSSAFANGEIRGQIAPARDRYAVICSAANESPPTPSTGIASGTLTLTATNQLIYDITYSGLISPYTISHIHNAPPGTNGGIVFFLQQTSPGHIQGITTPVATKGLPFLRCGRFYINIHSALFQSGEIRGQILPTFLGYGAGCAASGSSGIAPTLSGDGIATPGGTITIAIGGGVANSFGLLFVGIAGYAGSIGYGCPWLVHPAVLFPVPLALPAGGALSLPADLPTTTPLGVAVNLQYIGDQGGGVPYGTNGLQMIVVG